MLDKVGKSQSDDKITDIEGLMAIGPCPVFEEKLALFGQFIGDWDIVEARYPQPDGTVIKRRGEIQFGWILDGRAIQDVWVTYDEKPGDRFRPVRQYDTTIPRSMHGIALGSPLCKM